MRRAAPPANLAKVLWVAAVTTIAPSHSPAFRQIAADVSTTIAASRCPVFPAPDRAAWMTTAPNLARDSYVPCVCRGINAARGNVVDDGGGEFLSANQLMT